MSQIQMASQIGISFRNLQRLEMGEVEPRLETLTKIATCMGISITSLIRPTNGDNLFIREFSAAEEYKNFKDIVSINLLSHGDVALAQKMIQEDKMHNPQEHKDMRASIDGKTIQISESLSQLTGITAKHSDVDEYIAFGTCMERWELVFRANLKQALIQNFYFFPKGFKVFEEFHYNLKPNPDAPTSECYIRDITARHELESWLRVVNPHLELAR